MKKIKLITALSSLGTLVLTTPVVATSCSKIQDFKAIMYQNVIIYGEGKQALEPYPIGANDIWEVEAIDFKIILSDDSIKTPEKIGAVSKNSNYIQILDATDTSFIIKGVKKTAENQTIDVDITVEFEGQKGTATVQYTVLQAKPSITAVIGADEWFGGLDEEDIIMYDHSKDDPVKLINPVENGEYLELTAVNFTAGVTPSWEITGGTGGVEDGVSFTPDATGFKSTFKITDATKFEPGVQYTITARGSVLDLEYAEFYFNTSYDCTISAATAEEWDEEDWEWRPADYNSSLNIELLPASIEFKKSNIETITINEGGKITTIPYDNLNEPGKLWLDVSDISNKNITLKYQAEPEDEEKLQNGLVVIIYDDGKCLLEIDFLIPPSNK